MNLELYKKGLKVINDCENMEQLLNAGRYLIQISEKDKSLENALKYPLHIKMDEFSNNNRQ